MLGVRVGERRGVGVGFICSSSCIMLRLLFFTAWMSGERLFLMFCGSEVRVWVFSLGLNSRRSYRISRDILSFIYLFIS